MPMWTYVYINILSKVRHRKLVHTVHLQSYTYPMLLVCSFLTIFFFNAFRSQSCSTPISVILPLKIILKIFFSKIKKVGRYNLVLLINIISVIQAQSFNMRHMDRTSQLQSYKVSISKIIQYSVKNNYTEKFDDAFLLNI